jgi:DNA-binding MarR family transcriptional regulator
LLLDDYILDTLMPDLCGHDRQPSAFLVYLFLSRQAQRRRRVQIAQLDIAEGTGLSKRSVQTAIAWLAKRQLLEVRRESVTSVPVYTVLLPWRR